MSEILIYCTKCESWSDLDEIKNGQCRKCKQFMGNPIHYKTIGSLRKKEWDWLNSMFGKNSGDSRKAGT